MMKDDELKELKAQNDKLLVMLQILDKHDAELKILFKMIEALADCLGAKLVNVSDKPGEISWMAK